MSHARVTRQQQCTCLPYRQANYVVLVTRQTESVVLRLHSEHVKQDQSRACGYAATNVRYIRRLHGKHIICLVVTPPQIGLDSDVLAKCESVSCTLGVKSSEGFNVMVPLLNNGFKLVMITYMQRFGFIPHMAVLKDEQSDLEMAIRPSYENVINKKIHVH